MPTDPELAAASRTVARLAKQLDLALADADLTLPQYRALAFLARGTSAPSTLAGQLAVSRPTITALVDGLAARGLVERHPDLTDRRRVEHRLTAAGERALTAGDDAVARRLDGLLGFLPARDRARAVGALALWNDAIDRATAARLAALADPAR